MVEDGATPEDVGGKPSPLLSGEGRPWVKAALAEDLSRLLGAAARTACLVLYTFLFW